MKKIYILFESGESQLIGFANSLYEFLLETLDKIIVPFHGHIDYVLVHNIYCPEKDEFVSYRAL